MFLILGSQNSTKDRLGIYDLVNFLCAFVDEMQNKSDRLCFTENIPAPQNTMTT